MTSRQVKHTRLDFLNELIAQCAKSWLISVTFRNFRYFQKSQFFFLSLVNKGYGCLPTLLRFAVSEVLGCVGRTIVGCLIWRTSECGNSISA